MTNEYKSRHEIEQEIGKKCVWIQQIDVNPTTWGCQYADISLKAVGRGLVPNFDTNIVDAFYSEGYEGFVCNEHFDTCKACDQTKLDIAKGII
jgi:hypothetical protein